MAFENEEPASLSICEDCLQILANGEINDGTNRGEKCAAAMAEKWGDIHITLGTLEHNDGCKRETDSECDCEDLGFRTSDCDGCGSSFHGDRHAATAWIPKTSTNA